MKKVISLFIAIIVILSAFCMVASAEQTGDYYLMMAQVNNNLLFVNGISMDFDSQNPEVKPIMNENGEYLVPLRMVVGTAGGWIDWEEETDKVVMLYNGVSISFVMGSTEVMVGDEIVEISVAPYTIHDRTVVPLDFFINCMKGSVETDETTNTVMLAFETKVYAAG